jgi:allophycocyanin alpha subunit
MSIVTKSIVNADAEARYLSPGELDRIKSFVTTGERRLRIAQVLTESASASLSKLATNCSKSVLTLFLPVATLTVKK